MLKQLYGKHKEIINYLIVGVATTIVSLGIYYGLVLTILNPDDALELQLANIASWIGAVSFAYLTNRRFVFESGNKNILREAGAFFASRIASLVMDMAIMFMLVTVGHMSDKLAKLIVQVVVTIANYVLSKFLVFRKKGINE